MDLATVDRVVGTPDDYEDSFDAEPVPPAAGRAWAAAALSAGVAVAVLRLWVSRDRREYSLWPDEPAQLAIARFVGGGTHWTMRNHSIWRPGYGTLLGPVYAVTDDPLQVFRAAMALNAVLGAVAAAVLVVLARRLTGFRPFAAALAAVAVAATPALLFPTGFVWSESLIAPLYLGTVLALLRFWDAPALGRGLAVAALCGACFVTHSRLLPLALVTLLLVAMALEQRRLKPADAAIVVAGLAVALVAASRYSAFVTGRLWDDPSERNSTSGVLRQLADPAAIGLSAVGQAWYLLAGSLGVLAVAVVELARRVRTLPAYQVVGLVAVAQVALSVVFMADRWRPDQLIYGRYNDVVVAPLLLVGLAALAGRCAPSVAVRAGGRSPGTQGAAPGWWTAKRLAVTAVAGSLVTLGCGLAMWGLRSDELSESNGLEPMILAIQPFVDGRPTIPLLRITLLALAAAAVVALVATASRVFGAVWPIGVAVAVLLVVGATRTDDVLDRGWNGSGGLHEVAELAEPGGPLDGGRPADYYLPARSNSTGRLMLYQWYLPDSEITVVADPLVEATSPYVFAASDDPALEDAGAEVVWTDPIKPISLWDRRHAAAG